MSTKNEKDLNLVEGLLSDIAMDEAKRRKLSDEEKKELEEINASARAAVQAARQKALELAREERLAAQTPSIPARILAMSKDAIVTRLRELIDMYPGRLAVQHRKLEDEPLEDLQSLLADFEAQIAENSGGE